MGCKLAVGVLVRHPDSGVVEFLPPGSDCPEWAQGLVGGHALEGGESDRTDQSEDGAVGDDSAGRDDESRPTRGRPRKPRD